MQCAHASKTDQNLAACICNQDRPALSTVHMQSRQTTTMQCAYAIKTDHNHACAHAKKKTRTMQRVYAIKTDHNHACAHAKKIDQNHAACICNEKRPDLCSVHMQADGG